MYLELSNCISTSRETKWLVGLSLSKQSREVEANRKLAQGIRQFGKAMIVTSSSYSLAIGYVMSVICAAVVSGEPLHFS